MKKDKIIEYNNFNYNINAKQFFIYFIIFFLSVIVLVNVLSIINEKQESDYDKCLDSCSILKSEYKPLCISECQTILLIEKMDNIDLEDFIKILQ